MASSCLTLKDAKKLGIEYMSTCESLGFSKRHALKINYYDLAGNPLSDWPACPPFFRIRYLGNGFNPKERYAQPYNTFPVAYYPRNYDWQALPNDHPIIITEGELKAAASCKYGFPTIGLGGVYNWKSTKYEIDWIASMDYIHWPKRKVCIIFDSDFKVNPLVSTAIMQLADELHYRGALVSFGVLDSDGVKKVGLDDFLLECEDPQAELQAIIDDAVILNNTMQLWKLNNKYVCVEFPLCVVNLSTMNKYAFNNFHCVSSQVTSIKRLLPSGKVKIEKKPVLGPWLNWPLRTQVSSITYEPGKPKIHNDKLNFWPGWGVKPKHGDHSPFLNLIHHLIPNTGDADWFLDWLSYPLQYPGTKLFTSVLLFGIKHGTGKSLTGFTMGRIYGKNFTEIKQSDLMANHNEWAMHKQFVLGDDISSHTRGGNADTLKKMITQREVRINEKFIPAYTIKDTINYLFTSNQPDALFIEDGDRRFFIIEIESAPLEEIFYAEYDLWLDTGGSSAVFSYLKRRDLSNFNPAAPARKTLAKARMIADVRSDLASWVRELIATPDIILKQGNIQLKQDIFTNKELLTLYDPTGETKVTANGIGRELGRAGLHKVRGGAPTLMPDGKQKYFYAIRNPELWSKATTKEIIKHLC